MIAITFIFILINYILTVVSINNLNDLSKNESHVHVIKNHN